MQSAAASILLKRYVSSEDFYGSDIENLQFFAAGDANSFTRIISIRPTNGWKMKLSVHGLLCTRTLILGRVQPGGTSALSIIHWSTRVMIVQMPTWRGEDLQNGSR